MNVFKEQKFYPSEETSIKEHYAGTFDSVFLSFIPFFRIDEHQLCKTSFQRVHQITYPQFKSANPDLNLPENISANIYTNSNPNYPTADEIIQHGHPVKWSEVLSDVGFGSLAEIDKALGTTIGHYRAVFARQDLADRLLQYAEDSRTFLPEEGTYDVFSKMAILNAFRGLGKTTLVVHDEFLDNKTTIEIDGLTDEEFCKKIDFKDYYIHDVDKEILFAIDWDDFFFLIATSSSTMDFVLSTGSFEGFLCDENTKVYWELGDAELAAGLAKEAAEKSETGPTASEEPKFNMKPSTKRIILRIVHLVSVIPVLGYVYQPVAEAAEYQRFTQAVFIPVAILTGYWMYMGMIWGILGAGSWFALNYLVGGNNGFGYALLAQIVIFVVRTRWKKTQRKPVQVAA
jgi:hypothetical protein